MDKLIKDGVTRYKNLLGQGYDLLKSEVDTYDNVEIDSKKMTVMLFTSGTTAEPKAVMLSQTDLTAFASVSNVCSFISSFSMNPLMTSCSCLAFFFLILRFREY